MTQTFRANGKLLLTGEYFVLDGVSGLAVPTRKGQKLIVEQSPDSAGDRLSWLALDENYEQWFSATLQRSEWTGPRPQVQSEDIKARICQLLRAAEDLRPGCTASLAGTDITTELEFNRKWGLGSSSTLVACLAELLAVNPYSLLEKTFGGSGYDLACAVNDTPIRYVKTGPTVTPVRWRPDWVKDTVFVYRNQKQNSREGIRKYREQTVPETAKKEIADLSFALTSAALDLRAAAQILHRHEEIVSATIGLPTVQEELFSDFPGQLKSLGAWGGDFFWAISEEGPEKMQDFFNDRGFATVIGYEEMVL